MRHARLEIASLFLLLFGSMPLAQAQLQNTPIAGAKIMVDGQTVLIKLDASFEGNTLELPRLAAPLRSLKWQGEESTSNLKLQPELATWKLSWDKPPAGGAAIEMQLDAPPLLMSECKPIQATGDGSLFLPAHLATTQGDKIRYEPQTFKNTVGYWAGMQNSASWTMTIAKPGKFNVGILQGCGAGNGGSTAEVALVPLSAAEKPVAQLEFEVLETGHFQNFVWRNLGEIQITDAGEYQLRISPKNIKRAALMDVRAVHLIRLP